MTNCLYCGSLITIGHAAIWDAEKRVLSYRENHIQFPPYEAKLFDVLWQARGKLCWHGMLERKLWGYLEIDASSLGGVVYRARLKLPNGMKIHNVPNWQGEGGGYWLER